MRTRRHLKEVRRRCGGERPTADARRPCGDREKLLRALKRSSSRGLQIRRGRDLLDRINVGPQSVARYAGRLFGTEHPSCGSRLVRLQTLPDGALSDAYDPAERRLAASNLDSFCERFRRGDLFRHGRNL